MVECLQYLGCETADKVVVVKRRRFCPQSASLDSFGTEKRGPVYVHYQSLTTIATNSTYSVGTVHGSGLASYVECVVCACVYYYDSGPASQRGSVVDLPLSHTLPRVLGMPVTAEKRQRSPTKTCLQSAERACIFLKLKTTPFCSFVCVLVVL